jgi:hypothetical protein
MDRHQRHGHGQEGQPNLLGRALLLKQEEQ